MCRSDSAPAESLLEAKGEPAGNLLEACWKLRESLLEPCCTECTPIRPGGLLCKVGGCEQGRSIDGSLVSVLRSRTESFLGL